VISCNTSPHVQGVTKIKFTTDEALLKELHDDPLLSAYSVVVVDEVHERSLSTDLLLALLRKVRKHSLHCSAMLHSMRHCSVLLFMLSSCILSLGFVF
jgi:hypothetical protein